MRLSPWINVIHDMGQGHCFAQPPGIFHLNSLFYSLRWWCEERPLEVCNISNWERLREPGVRTSPSAESRGNTEDRQQRAVLVHTQTKKEVLPGGCTLWLLYLSLRPVEFCLAQQLTEFCCYLLVLLPGFLASFFQMKKNSEAQKER